MMLTQQGLCVTGVSFRGVENVLSEDHRAPMTGLAMMRLSPQRPIIATLGRGLADALACLLVLLTLLASPDVSRLTVGVFVSVPLEALLGVAILLLSPVRARPAI